MVAERSRKQGGGQTPILVPKPSPAAGGGGRKESWSRALPWAPPPEQASSPSHLAPTQAQLHLLPIFPLPAPGPPQRGWKVAEASGRLGAGVHLLVGPELLVLLAAKPLVVVAFALKQLLEVGFAVELPVQRGIAAQAELGVTVLAAEARVVENELVSHQPLHGVHGLLAGGAGLLHLGPQAEGLGALHRAAAAAFGIMRGGGLGGSCSLEHGLLEVEASGGDAAPAGFCKGKSVGRAPPVRPQPAGWGVLTGRGWGDCGWDFP